MTADASFDTGDGRLLPFRGKRGQQLAFVAAAATMAFVGSILWDAFANTGGSGPRALSIDFRVFWAAGQLALQGEPLAALDPVRLDAMHGVDVEGWMPWLYPPAYLMLVTPFGAMSFSAAFILSTVLSIGLVAWALRPFVGGVVPLWIAMALAPAYAPALMIGQNSVFWLAGLLAALAALRSQRWVLAGVFIGLLTLKPQLGLMIPVALLAIGAWRTILAAIATTLILALVPTGLYGSEYWPLLRDGIAAHGERALQMIGTVDLMVGPISLLAALGVPPPLALRVQWAFTALCAVLVFVLWRSRSASFDLKAAGLLAAVLPASPYVWHYETALMAAIGLFLVRAGVLGQRPLDLAVFGLLWLGGVLVVVNGSFDLVDGTWVGAALITPLLLGILALCVYRAVVRPITALPP